ncbi:MAG: SgcJ/EcaC family oxidoreductase [Acidobacteriales bacterium]|nr:SgcJ/EcaC family oxidoreductase [Terriglobales bacterium]
MTFRNLFLCAFSLALLLTFVGCQQAPPPEPKKDVAADMKAVDALRGQFAAAYNSGNAAAVAALYAEDGITMFANQPAVEGRQAIQTMLEGYFKEHSAKIVHTPLETQVLGDWGYERGNIAVTITPKSGKPVEDSIKYLVIVKRQPDGSWKLYRDIHNSNNPLPVAAGKKK